MRAMMNARSCWIRTTLNLGDFWQGEHLKMNRQCLNNWLSFEHVKRYIILSHWNQCVWALRIFLGSCHFIYHIWHEASFPFPLIKFIFKCVDWRELGFLILLRLQAKLQDIKLSLSCFNRAVSLWINKRRFTTFAYIKENIWAIKFMRILFYDHQIWTNIINFGNVPELNVICSI